MAKLPHVKAASPSIANLSSRSSAWARQMCGTVPVGQKNVILQGNAPSITAKFLILRLRQDGSSMKTDTEHHAPVVLLGFDTTNLLFPRREAGALSDRT